MSRIGQVRIRPARLADLDRLHYFETAYFGLDQFTRRQVWYLLTRANATTLVVEHGGQVVGAATMVWRTNSRIGRLYSIVLDSAARGYGLAAQLLKRCEALARKQGCARLRLEVRTDNEAAIRLYRRYGYSVERELTEYYTDGSDALQMTKELIQSHAAAQRKTDTAR